MALEDVVQGVQVSVKTDGVDDAVNKIDGVTKAVENLAAAGSKASGGGGGIEGLNTAFKNIGTTAAQSFSQILSSATSGNLTGLATLMGGPVAGSFTQAAEQLSQFIDQQDAAILKTASMARAMGTTPEVIQGMGAALGEAGVSASGFERLVNRMSTRVATDYASMMKNIRTDHDTAASSALRVTKANEKLQESYGVPKEAFAEQDKWIAQQEAQIAKNEAIEAQREQALKSIPNITEKLKEGIKTHKESADVADTDIQTLTKSLENLARTGTGPASGLDVIQKLFEGIQTGAIGAEKGLALIKAEMGSMRAGGAGGMDAEKLLKFAQDGGLAKMQAATAEIAAHGLGITKQDVDNAEKAAAAGAKLLQVIDAMKEKSAAAIAPIKAVAETNAAHNLEQLPGIVDAISSATKGAADWMKSLLPQGLIDFFTKPTGATPFHGLDILHGGGPLTGGPSSGTPGTPGIVRPGDKDDPNSPIKVLRFGHSNQPGPGVKTEQTSGTTRIYHLPDDGAAPMAGGGQPLPPEGRGYGGGAAVDINASGATVSGALNSLAGVITEGAAAIKAALGGLVVHTTSGAPNTPTGDQSRRDARTWPGGGGGGPVTHETISVTDPMNAPWRTGGATNMLPSVGTEGAGDARVGSGPSGEPPPHPEADAANMPTSTSKEISGREVATALKQAGADSIGGGASGISSAFTSVASAIGGGGTSVASALMSLASKLSSLVPNPNAVPGTPGTPGYPGTPGAMPGPPSPRPLPYGATVGAKDIVIGNNPGGSIDVADSYWQRIHDKKDKVHFRGDCVSACVMSTGLPYNEGCVEPTARFGIHMASTNGVPDQQATNAMVAKYYPAKLQDYIKTHPLRPDVQYLNAAMITALGIFPPCPADSKNIPQGRQPHFCEGGICDGVVRGPGTDVSDSVLARLSKGEFVMRAAAVRAYGEDTMHAMNNIQMPSQRYAMGGMVPTSSLPYFAAGGAIEKADSILNLTIGDQTFDGLKVPDNVAAKLKQFAIGQQTSSTGRKPSWAAG